MRAVGLILCVAGVLGLAGGQFAAVQADETVRAAERARVEMLARVAPSVVSIFEAAGNNGGSGVLITPDGYALTNFHVTSGAGNFMKCGLNDGQLYDAVIVGIDPTGDVALIKLVGRTDFPVATMGDSDDVRVGDWVAALGNPFLLASDFSPTVTYGIVSGVHRYQYPAGTILEYADCLQVDASINPGNSGGPLFDAQGRLIGINGRGSFEKRGRVNSGAGYAISINQIKYFIDHLRSGRIVDHATLGAVVRLQEKKGLVIDSILEQSDAYRRGLRDGDEILALGGKPVDSVNQIKNILGIYPKGWRVPVAFRREGKRQEIVVELRGVHRASELLGEPQGKSRDGKPRPGMPPSPKQPQPPKPNKRPSEQPHEDEAEPSQGPTPPGPGGHAHPATPEPSATLREMFEVKPGFANYHFNRLEQTRVLAGLEPFRSHRQATGRWKLSGKTAAGESFEFKLNDALLGLTWKQLPYLQPVDGTDWLDEPKGSGGLLAAMHQLRWMLTRGPEGFTEVTYLGRLPIEQHADWADVIYTTHNGLETQWYFDRQSHRLLGMDVAIAVDVDPCQLRWADTQTLGGHQFPSRIQVRHADRDVTTLEFSTAEFLGE